MIDWWWPFDLCSAWGREVRASRGDQFSFYGFHVLIREISHKKSLVIYFSVPNLTTNMLSCEEILAEL